MTTPSTATIRRLAELVHDQSQRYGLIGPEIGYSLQEGSPTNGRAWRLYTLEPVLAGLYDGYGLGNGYIGWTKDDVETTLRGMLAVLQLVSNKARQAEVQS